MTEKEMNLKNQEEKVEKAQELTNEQEQSKAEDTVKVKAEATDESTEEEKVEFPTKDEAAVSGKTKTEKSSESTVNEVKEEVLVEPVDETKEELNEEVKEEAIVEVKEEKIALVEESKEVEAIKVDEPAKETEPVTEPEEIIEASAETKEVEEKPAPEQVVAETKEEAPLVVEEAEPVSETKEVKDKPVHEDVVAETKEELMVAVKEAEPATQKEETKEAAVESKEVEDKPVQKNLAVETKEESPQAPEETIVAKGSEKEGAPEVELDFTELSKAELINYLTERLDTVHISKIKGEVDRVKSTFYKKYRSEIEEQRRKFIDEGGDATEFKYEQDPLEETLKELLSRYKRLRFEYAETIEKEKVINLSKKYEIIEKINELINSQESLNKTFNDFRDLQEDWHVIGLVPQSEVKNLWETYHHTVEKFYDYIKINRELRDLDLKKNLEAKVILCERAEELLIEPSAVKAFNALQKLHDQWREIGPVPREKREEMWERFKLATTTINKNHQDYYQSLKEEQDNNLKAKVLLCEKSEELANLSIDSPKIWDEKSNELIELQKLWKTIGFATKKENTKIFERFRKACDQFFANKRDYYQEYKDEQNNNLQLKTELCMKAEAIKDSNDWKNITNELIRIQKEWKNIGPVPRKHSDALWKRFRAACNEFFEKKSEFFSSIDDVQDQNLKQKQELIEQVKAFKHEENIEETLKTLREFQSQWTEIGHVPFKMKDKVQKEFREAVNKQFDSLKIDEVKRNVLIFKQRIEGVAQEENGSRQLRYEREKILERVKQLESDIVLLDNNIGFFAKTKNAESLIKDVNKKIETARTRIKIEKQKLDLIRKVE
jgi:hypothetical protein